VNRLIRARTRAFVLASFMLVVGACVSAPSADSPREYLDETTAATITVVAQPLVFAHERPDVAVYTRDYVTLAAASINRGGRIQYVLVGYFWSTLDTRTQRAAAPAADSLVIAADDRRIRPALEGLAPREVGIGTAVHAPPGRLASPKVYRTDPGTLRFIAEARRVTVSAGADGSGVTYEIWEDQRAALRSFVRSLGETK
jgi:hypothetical protein